SASVSHRRSVNSLGSGIRPCPAFAHSPAMPLTSPPFCSRNRQSVAMGPAKRFSSRADNYAKYRPGYPARVIDILRQSCGLRETSIIADVGSGTGIITELFLKNGSPVFAIEPNVAMRAIAERLLIGYSKFVSVAGSAEATTPAEQSVAFFVVAQAFYRV